MEDKTLKKILAIVVLIFIAVLSFFLIADRTTNADTNAATIASLDDKAQTVLKLTATSTLASAGVSAIPGDTATPIAEKLADFTGYFALILCVLYAEKYLLAIIGSATFKILIPIACALLIVSIFWNPKLMRKLAFKFAVFGLAIFICIPTSIRVSDAIYDSYRSSVEQAVVEAEEFTDETDELTTAENDNVISSIIHSITGTASDLYSKATDVLNNYVEAFAILIVTSCIIPILVLVFFVWLIKVLTGIDIQLPPMHKPGKKEKEPAA